MSYLIRCPSSIGLPDGTFVRCGTIKRVDISPEREAAALFLGMATTCCERCGARFYTTAPADGGRFGHASEGW